MAEFSAGQQLNAEHLNGILPLCAFKSADESVSNNTYQNDDHLVVAVEANRDYIVEVLLLFTGGATGDAKWQFTMPAGAVLTWGIYTIDTGGTIATVGNSNQSSPAGNSQTGTVGTSTYRATFIRGTLEVGGTAGNFQLQWAQNTTDATATVLRRGSHLMLTRCPA